MAMTEMEMNQNIVFANQGDKVKLRSGEIVEFIKLNRTKFVFKRNGDAYNTPVENFVEIVEKAPIKKISQTYKKLKDGELFFINHKGQAIMFAFVEIKNGKIVGRNPIDGAKTTIDIGLYGGKITELKKLLEE